MKSPLLRSLFDDAERRPLTVSELTGQVRAALEQRFASVWLEGEISNFKAHTSGHWYFTIKDQTSQLRSVCLRPNNSRIRFRPSNGLQVRARGRLSVYEPRGEYELMVEGLDPIGAGALKVAYEQLRERLEREGLFDEKLKRPLALLPRRVALITSLSGAAIHDMLHIINARTRTVDIIIVPVRVQGEAAGAEIAAAIDLVNEYSKTLTEENNEQPIEKKQPIEWQPIEKEQMVEGQPIDAIIVGRGGGSIEDLWAFNDEAIARAMRRSKIPVISAVGHESDFTISDFAADVRAATPTAAAELVSEHEGAIATHVEALSVALARAMQLRLRDAQDELDSVADSARFAAVLERVRDAQSRTRNAHHRLEILAARKLETARRKLNQTVQRLSPARAVKRTSAARARLSIANAKLAAAAQAEQDARQTHLSILIAQLDALSPLAVLSRGYALTLDAQGQIIRRAQQTKIGDAVSVRLNQGVLHCTVEDITTRENVAHQK